MKTCLWGAVSARIVSLSLVLNTAHANLNYETNEQVSVV
jgi:hypothetical protein